MDGTTLLRGFLLVVEVLSAFMLVVIILMQKSKSQGMGLAFGGAMGESLFGAQMGNVLTKATVVLGIIFLVNTTLLAMIGPAGAPKSIADTIGAEPVPMTQPAPMTQPMPLAPPAPPSIPAE
jgi:preprotein translocase subunit SecG